MPENRSNISELWRESSQKFDYFVAGLVGALVAYVGQSFTAEPIGLNPGSLELLALFLLIASFWSGFKRIEANTETLRLTFERNRADDLLIELRNGFEGGRISRDIHSGRPLSPSEQQALLTKYSNDSNAADKHLGTYATKAYRYYHGRNYLLIGGFILLVVARVLKVY